MIIKKEYAYLFFIACMVTGVIILIGIMLMPMDLNIACKPILEQVNYYCICSKNITVP